MGSFYAYCQEHGLDPLCGAGFNPVNGARRPKISNYEKVRGLSEKEEAALLEAIQRDDSSISKRDYALVMALLKTGWKSMKVRTLTWGELREKTGDKGKVASLRGVGVTVSIALPIRAGEWGEGVWGISLLT